MQERKIVEIELSISRIPKKEKKKIKKLSAPCPKKAYINYQPFKHQDQPENLAREIINKFLKKRAVSSEGMTHCSNLSIGSRLKVQSQYRESNNVVENKNRMGRNIRSGQDCINFRIIVTDSYGLLELRNYNCKQSSWFLPRQIGPS